MGMKGVVPWLTLTLHVTLILALGTHTSPSMDALVKKLDDLEYDKHLRPEHESGNHTVVTIFVIVTSISSIDEVDMDMDIDLFVQRRWSDKRLKGLSTDKNIQVFGSLENRIWQPHVYFVNSKSSRYHNVTTWVREVHINTIDGRVFSNVRVTVKLSCPMQLEYFPMDNQTCSLMMEAGHPIDIVKLQWAKDEPVTVNNLTLPKFNLLRRPMPGECAKSYLAVNFSCLRLEISMVRQFGYFLIQVYAPTFCLVLMSWVSFWLTVDASPARTTLGTITVLTITTQTGSVNNAVPKVSYIKAMDIWFIACVAFVFAAFLEFAVVNGVYRYTRKRRLRHLERKRRRLKELEQATIVGRSVFWVNDENDEKDPEQNHDLNNDSTMVNLKYQIEDHMERSFGCNCCHMSSDVIDRISRWLFPAGFAIFNAIYWAIYGSHAVFGDWDVLIAPGENKTVLWTYGIETRPANLTGGGAACDSTYFCSGSNN